MIYTYSHFEKVTIPLKRNRLQKLLNMPSEASIWQRRSWTGSKLDMTVLGRNIAKGSVDVGTILIWSQMLEERPTTSEYIKTTGHKVES